MMKVLRPTLFCTTFAILVASTPASQAQVAVFNITTTSNGPLRSTAPSNIAAVIQSSSAAPGTLHVFVEEYPSGSGCGGDRHQTNGGQDFQVPAGPWTRRFVFPWFGHQMAAGFLRVGARLDNGDAAWSSNCFPYGP
jgi:hypothetical protein